MRRAPVVVCLVFLLGQAATAEARIPHVLRAGTRAWWVAGGLGPALAFGDAITQTKLMQTVGIHFLGRTEGPALALEVQQGLGYDALSIEVMPRFVWDIAVVEDLAFYITPGVGVGYVYVDDDRQQRTEDDGSGITVQLALEARLVINDRGLIFLRPVNIDILNVNFNKVDPNATPPTEWQTRVRWDILIGGGVTF